MDIQKFLEASSAIARNTRSSYHLTLGQLIKKLQVMHPDMLVRLDTDLSVGAPESYRGYYADLSFPPSTDQAHVSTVLNWASTALGETFQGYKGGDFVMGEDTPLWTAPYGDTGSAIVGIDIVDSVVTLRTKTVD